MTTNITDIFPNITDDERGEACRAHARLIASAPELAEALLGLLDRSEPQAHALGTECQFAACEYCAARAALAKAGLLS